MQNTGHCFKRKNTYNESRKWLFVYGHMLVLCRGLRQGVLITHGRSYRTG